MPGKKIGDLNAYGSINTDTSRRSRLEIDRNSGTYSSPIYGPDDSCKITLEELKEALNIKEYLVNEVIGKTNGDTLEVDKINVLNLTSNATFTLPTASLAYKGKALIIIQSNVNNYKAVINGAAQGPINISDFRDVIIFNCVFDGTSSYDWFAISKDDSKICNRLVVVSSSTYTANANDNIQANAQSLGSDIDITIPTAGIEGRLIYAYYPTGSPSAFVVELIGGFTATLVQRDYFLIRDNGSYWEAISTSQNTAPTPTLDTVTGAGDTTTNSVTVGGLVVDMPSGSGVAVDITKGGNGEALTVNKTSGSGNVASFTGGITSLQDAEITSATANRPAFFDSAKKLVIATGALFGTWLNGLSAKSTPVGADTIIVNDSASSFEAKKTTLTQLWTNYLRAFVFATSLTTNRLTRWNGSVLVDSIIEDDGGGVVYARGTATGYGIKNNTGTTIGWVRYYNTNDAIVTLATGASSVITGHEPSGTVFLISSGIVEAKSNVFEFKNNTSPQTRFGRFTIDGLAIGSATINASAQSQADATNKGSLIRNRVTTSQKTSISTPANGLNVYDTDLATDSNYTTRNSINSWIDSKIKFSELFDPFLIDQQVTANGTAYVARFKPKSDMIITAIEFIVTAFTSSETYYVGVYDSTLTTKLTDGSVSITSTGEKQISVTQIKLTGATTYYLVIKDNAGGTLSVGASTSYANTLICASKYIGTGALPANLTTGGSPTADTKAPYMAVISL